MAVLMATNVGEVLITMVVAEGIYCGMATVVLVVNGGNERPDGNCMMVEDELQDGRRRKL